MPTEEERRLRSGRRNETMSGSNEVWRPLPYLNMIPAVMMIAGIITCPQVSVMGMPMACLGPHCWCMGTPVISPMNMDGRDNQQQDGSRVLRGRGSRRGFRTRGRPIRGVPYSYQTRDEHRVPTTSCNDRHNSGVSVPVPRCLHGVSQPAILTGQVCPSRQAQCPQRPDCVPTASSSGSFPPFNTVKTEMELDEQRLKSLPKKLSSPKIVKYLVKAEYWSTLRLALVRFDVRFSRSALRTMSKMTIEATEGLGIFEGLVRRFSEVEEPKTREMPWQDCNLLIAIVATVIEFGLLDQYKILTKCNAFMRGTLLSQAWCLVSNACLYKLNRIHGPSEYPPGHPLCDWKPDYNGCLALAAELGILQTARVREYICRKYAFERIAVKYNQLDMLRFLVSSGGATMKTLRELHSDDIFTEERKKATEGNDRKVLSSPPEEGNATAQEAPKEAIYKYLTNLVSKPLPLQLQCVLKLTSRLDWGWDRLEKIQRLTVANPIKDLLSFRRLLETDK